MINTRDITTHTNAETNIGISMTIKEVIQDTNGDSSTTSTEEMKMDTVTLTMGIEENTPIDLTKEATLVTEITSSIETTIVTEITTSEEKQTKTVDTMEEEEKSMGKGDTQVGQLTINRDS